MSVLSVRPFILKEESPLKKSSELQIVFFDGVCNLCNASVDFIIKRNKKKNLYIAPLQGQTAKELLDVRYRTFFGSLIYYDRGKSYIASEAALRIAGQLKFPWSLLRFFLFVPKFIRDRVYFFIAKNRYRFFGQQETCRLPLPEEKKYFLE